MVEDGARLFSEESGEADVCDDGVIDYPLFKRIVKDMVPTKHSYVR